MRDDEIVVTDGGVDVGSSERSHRECDWCNEQAEHNKDIYYACDEHASELSELMEL